MVVSGMNARDEARRAGLTEAEIEAWEEQLVGQVAKGLVGTGLGYNALTVYDYRERGRDYCRTEGSDHYMLPGVEPLDLMISCGYAEHHCLANIIKYAVRYGESGNPRDLKKIADYAHILCGLRLAEEEAEK